MNSRWIEKYLARHIVFSTIILKSVIHNALQSFQIQHCTHPNDCTNNRKAISPHELIDVTPQWL